MNTLRGAARPVNLTTSVMQHDDLDLLILYERTLLHRFREKTYIQSHLTFTGQSLMKLAYNSYFLWDLDIIVAFFIQTFLQSFLWTETIADNC